jgi:DNA-binding beta-propeller fold protein YncE
MNVVFFVSLYLRYVEEISHIDRLLSENNYFDVVPNFDSPEWPRMVGGRRRLLALSPCTTRCLFPATRFHGPSSIAYDNNQRALFVTNELDNTVVKQLDTHAIIFGGASSASKGKFNRPIGVAVNSHGVAYVTNVMSTNGVYFVTRIYPSGKVDTALSGAPLNGPIGIAVDSKDSLYIANSQANNVVVLDYGAQATSSRVIAGGVSRFSRAQLINPQGIAIGQKEEIYVTNGM